MTSSMDGGQHKLILEDLRVGQRFLSRTQTLDAGEIKAFAPSWLRKGQMHRLRRKRAASDYAASSRCRLYVTWAKVPVVRYIRLSAMTIIDQAKVSDSPTLLLVPRSYSGCDSADRVHAHQNCVSGFAQLSVLILRPWGYYSHGHFLISPIAHPLKLVPLHPIISQ